MDTQAHFAIEHGRRTTDRMINALLEAIMKKLSEGIEVDGKKLEIKQLGTVKEQDGVMRLLFDVKNPDEIFDHIEFKVTKTGWGRKL